MGIFVVRASSGWKCHSKRGLKNGERTCMYGWFRRGRDDGVQAAGTVSNSLSLAYWICAPVCVCGARLRFGSRSVSVAMAEQWRDDGSHTNGCPR